jgi:protein-disulfide isomerase
MATHIHHRPAAQVARAARGGNHATQMRSRLLWLAGLVIVVVAVVAAIAAIGGGSAKKPASAASNASTVNGVAALLKGIPQAGNTLGSSSAPTTVTLYSDLVCPACAAWATSVLPQIITTEVRTGKIRLVDRGFETASGIANGGEYTTSQTAVLSAGLQNRAWNYVLLAYDEQPQTINGQDAEDVSYVNSSYLQNLAAQVPGLNRLKWQAGLTNQTLISDVSADAQSGRTSGITATPSLLVAGAKGTVRVEGGPSLSQLQSAMAQVG